MHDYLEMNLEYCKYDKVKIYMIEHLLKVLEDILEQFKLHILIPMENHLFKVSDMDKTLSKEYAQIFHTLVMKRIFMEKKVQPDILTSVSFLKKRKREPGMYDNKKMGQVLKYLQ